MWGRIELVAIGMVLGLGWFHSVAADATVPFVVINELSWAGSSLSAQDEWIELKNTTSDLVDVSGWQITKNTTGEEVLMFTLPTDSSIPASGYWLVSNYAAAESVLAIEPDVVDSAITLSNTKLLIKLYDGQWDDGREPIDIAGDGEAPPAGNNSTKSSMERDNDYINWHDAVEAINLDNGIIDLGTPQADNSTFLPPPTLTSVLPVEVIPSDILEIEEIIGTNFSISPLPTIQLTQETTTLIGSDTNVVHNMLIDYVRFDISNAAAGQWDLVLTNPDNKTAVLPDAITILEPAPEFDLITTIRINEIYPKPSTTSNDEFIELYNFGDTAINLTGWQLDDIRSGGSSPYIFSGVVINAQSFVVIYKPASKITLNDSGDTVHLIQPNDFVLDHVNYNNTERGLTLSRFPEGWKWTETPTPNGENVLTKTAKEPPAEEYLEPDDVEESLPEYSPRSILITEALPNPSDGDEFIELFNNTDESIDLTDWQLEDASGKTYTINNFDVMVQSTNLDIEPGKFVVVTQSISKIYLNNSGGETLQLLDPTGVVIDEMSYPDKAPVGAAYVYVEDEGYWTWTDTPTPGAANLVILEEDIEIIEETMPVSEPLPELVSSGPAASRWIGIILVSFACTAMLFWYWEEKYVQRASNRYHQSIKNSPTW